MYDTLMRLPFLGWVLFVTTAQLAGLSQMNAMPMDCRLSELYCNPVIDHRISVSDCRGRHFADPSVREGQWSGTTHIGLGRHLSRV